MIRKSGHRLSEQIMLKQKDRARWRFNEKRSRFGCADQGDPRRGRQMTSEHLDWDNLRYFLAVARAGKLTAAARRLGQDHTTVGRRIASLESAFRSKLTAIIGRLRCNALKGERRHCAGWFRPRW